jgi:putative DNA primase/helicase
MAGELDLAVVTIAHPNKASGASGLDRLSGSAAFGNAARSVIVFGADPSDPEGTTGGQRVIGHLKCNVGKKSPSLTASLELVEIQTEDGPVEQTRLKVTGSSGLAAEELLGPGTETERDSAAEFLEDLLSKGPIRSAEIKEAAEGNGFAWRTAQRAKADLGIKAVKKPDGWYWALAEWEES